MLTQRLCWLAALVASGCFGLDVSDGQVPCGARGECPSGFRCSAARCWRASLLPPDDAALADGQHAPPDARPDATADAALDAGSDARPPVDARTDAAGPADAAPVADASLVVDLLLGAVGPGSASVTPEGASCGPGCFTYGRGATVLLTPTPDPGYSFIGWTGGGCEASGPSQCVAVLSADTAIVAHFCAAHVVVDATSGDDRAAGTCAAPFKTIGKALSVALPGQTVQVQPGVYAAPAETFPLAIPDGVTVLGDEDHKGGGATPTRVEGGGPIVGSPGLRAALVLGTSSVLAGFTVVDSAPVDGSNGIVVTKPSPGSATGAIIRNNTVTMSTAGGITLERARNAILIGNQITGQVGGALGVRITADAADALLEGNLITGNTIGVQINASAVLGGGSRGSAGRNLLSCNVEIDVIASGPAAAPLTVSARNDQWDHVPPNSSSGGCASNLDLCLIYASVDTSGAVRAANFCD